MCFDVIDQKTTSRKPNGIVCCRKLFSMCYVCVMARVDSWFSKVDLSVGSSNQCLLHYCNLFRKERSTDIFWRNLDGFSWSFGISKLNCISGYLAV